MRREAAIMKYGKCARKAGDTIQAALAVVVISVGPVVAQEGAFHALFGDERLLLGLSYSVRTE